MPCLVGTRHCSVQRTANCPLQSCHRLATKTLACPSRAHLCVCILDTVPTLDRKRRTVPVCGSCQSDHQYQNSPCHPSSKEHNSELPATMPLALTALQPSALLRPRRKAGQRVLLFLRALSVMQLAVTSGCALPAPLHRKPLVRQRSSAVGWTGSDSVDSRSITCILNGASILLVMMV